MAVTFGNSGSGGQSYSANNNGDFFVAAMSSTTNDVSAAAFNGVSMTQAGTAQANAGSGRYLSVWVLANAPVGNFTLSFTGGTNHDSIWTSALGTSLTNPYTNVTASSGTSGTATLTLTTTSAGSYVFGYQFSSNTAATGANTSRIGSASYRAFYYSTTPVNTASGTITTTFTSNDWNFIGFSLNAVPSNLPMMSHMFQTGVGM